jgi:hypothetical protein
LESPLWWSARKCIDLHASPVADEDANSVDEVAKSSTMLWENMSDPKTATSENPSHSPLQRFFNHNLPFFEWLSLPEQGHRRRRFAAAIAGNAADLGGEESVFNGASNLSINAGRY